MLNIMETKKLIIQIFCANQIIHWCSMRIKTASVAHLVQSINNIVTSFSHNHFINSLLEGKRIFFRKVMMCSKQKCSAIKYQGRLIWNVFLRAKTRKKKLLQQGKSRKDKFHPKKMKNPTWKLSWMAKRVLVQRKSILVRGKRKDGDQLLVTLHSGPTSRS